MPTMRIGQLAERSGVSVKTIRYYSDRGLLPPTDVSAGGYRLYNDADRARLELIRTLRSLDFPLEQIRRLLASRADTADILRTQLDAMELQLRDLTRRRLVLQRALAEEKQPLDRLDRLDTLCRLSAHERAEFVRHALRDRTVGVDVDRDWLDELIAQTFGSVPEALSAVGLEAWLELASLVADPRFLESLRQAREPSLTARASRRDPRAWHVQMMALLDRAARQVACGTTPGDARAHALADELVNMHARALPDSADSLGERLLGEIDAQRDPRAERFWELVGILRGDPTPAARTRAFGWLKAALRSVVAQRRPAGDASGRGDCGD